MPCHDSVTYRSIRKIVKSKKGVRTVKDKGCKNKNVSNKLYQQNFSNPNVPHSENESSKDHNSNIGFDTEIPTNIFFPEELNTYLRNQIEALKEENGRLRRLLAERESELKAAKSVNPSAPSTAAVGLGCASDVAAIKIVELSKRVRELTSELEVTKLRCLRAETQTEPTKQEICENIVRNDGDTITTASRESQIKELNDKLNSTNTKLCETRNQCQQLKHELKLAHKTLINEIGTDTVPNTGQNWRGRAQQILTLQKRVQELTDKLSATGSDTVDKASNSVLVAMRHAEKEKKAELEKEVAATKGQLDEMRRRLDGAKARTRVLEGEVLTLRSRVSTLLDKTTHDDQLIAALTGQLAAVSEKMCARDQDKATKAEEQCMMLEQELAHEKSRTCQLESAVAERDELVHKLEETLKERRLVKLGTYVDEENYIKNSSSKTNYTPSQQNAINITAEAERLRLLELLAVLNKRLDNQRERADELQDNLRRERKKSARMETKIARLELERVSVPKVTSYHRCPPPSKKNFSSQENDLQNEELKDRIEIVEEECLYYRTRLDSLKQEKEEDLNRYMLLLEDARQSYVEAKRKLLQD